MKNMVTLFFFLRLLLISTFVFGDNELDLQIIKKNKKLANGISNDYILLIPCKLKIHFYKSNENVICFKNKKEFIKKIILLSENHDLIVLYIGDLKELNNINLIKIILKNSIDLGTPIIGSDKNKLYPFSLAGYTYDKKNNNFSLTINQKLNDVFIINFQDDQ